MLSRLSISNLTVFERAELEFNDRGLVVISGETGAGKTVLTHAIVAIGGADIDSSLIGPHGDEGYAEAEFRGPVPAALADVADEDADSFVLARRVRRTGSRALVDGRSCSAKVLRDGSQSLISLTGQHAARQLVDPAYQRALLDRFGGLEAQRAAVADVHRASLHARAEHQAAREQLAESARREELLRHELDMVRSLDPQPDEEDVLKAERERLRHADDLYRGVHAAVALLCGDEETQAVDMIARASGELLDAGRHDPQLATLGSELDTIADRINEIAREVRGLADHYEADPVRLEEVEQRLSALSDLRRRYGGAEITEILTRIDADARELALLDSADAHLADLQQRVAAAEQAYDAAAAKLSAARRKAAGKLTKATERHLHELGLTGARFHADFEDIDPGGQHGRERVVFSLQANAGMKPAALDRGASGGELSRVNLALLLAAEADSDTALIFDEVDAGIGGDVAHILGRKLKELAARTQVIVITHLAQIAVHADQHFKVQKTSKGRAVTKAEVRSLTGDERDAELARLIGADSSEAKQASELVRRAAGLAA